jgi:hypothetical protein
MVVYNIELISIFVLGLVEMVLVVRVDDVYQFEVVVSGAIIILVLLCIHFVLVH